MGHGLIGRSTERWEWLLATVVSLGAMVSLALLLVAVTGAPGLTPVALRVGEQASCSESGCRVGVAAGSCCPQGLSGAVCETGSGLTCGEGARLCALANGAGEAVMARAPARLAEWGGHRAYWLATAVVCAWVLSLMAIGDPFQRRRCERRRSRRP